MSSNITLEFIGPVNMYLGMGMKIVAAIFCGGLIGMDRELKMKPAGIKTNVLICLGSTLYTAVAILNHLDSSGLNAFDPNRTVAQIVSGIGFLGAGAIIHGKGEFVTGLTTAATIWTVAAVGVTIGTGYVFVALIFTITVLVVLWLIDPLFTLLNIMSITSMEILSMGSVSGVPQVKRVNYKIVQRR